MTQSLFSIRSLEEAKLALQGNPGILDLKDPNSGALGALDSATICGIVQTVHAMQGTDWMAAADAPSDAPRQSAMQQTASSATPLSAGADAPCKSAMQQTASSATPLSAGADAPRKSAMQQTAPSATPLSAGADAPCQSAMRQTAPSAESDAPRQSAMQPTPTPISATVGDLPPDPELIADKVRELMKCGVDYIKIGMFGPEYIETCPRALQQYAKQIPLVAVLFADRFEHFDGPCELLAYAGFAGVMLDTADKQKGGLRQLLGDDRLKGFVEKAHQRSLLCGLAGSLSKDDVAPLLALKPDFLGFRSALCDSRQRQASLSETAMMELAAMFNQTEQTIAV